MTRTQANAIIVAAVDQLLAEQPELLDLDAGERTLSHHLARYIAALVPSDLALSVDVEYNRHRADPKRLTLPPRRALDRKPRATMVLPDIIVHRRGTDRCNTVVLELKKPGEDQAYDALKLHRFREALGYQHAAHVILGRTRQGDLVREVVWQD